VKDRSLGSAPLAWFQQHSRPAEPVRRRAGIQQAKLFLEDVRDGVLDLGAGEWRVVLEVAALNLELASAAEQEQILAGFRAFLNGLTFPVQILVRSERLGAEDYQALLAERARAEPSPAIRDLALAQASFVRTLVTGRVLLRRRFFLVLPAPPVAPVRPGGSRWLALLGLTARPAGPAPASVRALLARRQAAVIRGLEGVGLQARPLGSADVLALYQTMLCPTLARLQPLARRIADATVPVVGAAGRDAPRSGGEA
jgi:hypothetical protein